jgi:ribosomal protein L17
MKYLTILLLFVFIGEGYSQKIQIKDGQIMKDKVPVAKLEGETKLLSGTNLKIKTLTDEPMVTIRTRTVDYHSHFQPATEFLEFHFVPANIKVSRLDVISHTSEKKIVGYLFDEIGKDFLTQKGVDTILIKSFARKNDEASKIKEDTLKRLELISFYQNAIKEPGPTRNREASITFHDFSRTLLSWDGYNAMTKSYYSDWTFQGIYQDKTLLGIVIKEMVKDVPNAPACSAVQYFILKKITAAKIQGKSRDFAPLALLTAQPQSVSDFFKVEGDNQQWTLLEKADYRNKEHVLVKELIKAGLL